MKKNRPNANKDTFLMKMSFFVRENQNSLIFIGIAIGLLIALYLGYQNLYLAPREEKAANEIFRAEEYVTIDSLADRAITGDGSYAGFEKISEMYSGTKSANLANVYLGGLLLRRGEFQKAITVLGKYNFTGSSIIDPLVLGMLGDACSELKDYSKAVTYYKKAFEKNANDLTSPLFLKKLGLVFEKEKQYRQALEAYRKIKDEYPKSFEAHHIEAYLARVKVKI